MVRIKIAVGKVIVTPKIVHHNTQQEGTRARQSILLSLKGSTPQVLSLETQQSTLLLREGSIPQEELQEGQLSVLLIHITTGGANLRESTLPGLPKAETKQSILLKKGQSILLIVIVIATERGTQMKSTLQGIPQEKDTYRKEGNINMTRDLKNEIRIKTIIRVV